MHAYKFCVSVHMHRLVEYFSLFLYANMYNPRILYSCSHEYMWKFSDLPDTLNKPFLSQESQVIFLTLPPQRWVPAGTVSSSANCWSKGLLATWLLPWDFLHQFLEVSCLFCLSLFFFSLISPNCTFLRKGFCLFWLFACLKIFFPLPSTWIEDLPMYRVLGWNYFYF